MKTLLLIFTLLFSASAYAQTDTMYCIQILSTRHPEYVRAEHLAMCTLDNALVEQTDSLYRIMFAYDTYEEAEIMLTTWKRAHKDAFITVRTREEYYNLKLFYTND